ncbi:Sec8_exocyst domain-containing protein [Meloidogyne graminicola]|uniref:Exocyst complex component Sec8 n=1 Tax=Meloidogyne graminicola TaxID=189291 RepID=A0A8S9ZR93_9BILA|nr:Sec8_exocyst domain-containing protein [Meloidogyne graminicola]
MSEKDHNFNCETNSPILAEGLSSELLINVIRTLTSTSSDDQRQLERERIEQGYQQSEKNIDKLLREHRADVMQCLNTFQSVSRSLTNSREQIKNVKNSLSLCKTFLQCRRDDLNKFWLENSHQKAVCDILRQMKQIRDIDKINETLLANGQYRELVDVLKDAGPLSNLEGISQLKFIVSENLQSNDLRKILLTELLFVKIKKTKQIKFIFKNYFNTEGFPKIEKLFDHIVKEIIQNCFVEPFEIQMLTLAKDDKLKEFKIGSSLIERYPKKKIFQLEDEEFMKKRYFELFQILFFFDKIDSALNSLFTQIPNLLFKFANETAKMIIQINNDGNIVCPKDNELLVNYVRILITQLSECSKQFAILSGELQNIGYTPKIPILRRFWSISLEGMEEILSEHLNVWRNKKQPNSEQESCGGQKKLFSFENASFVSYVIMKLKINWEMIIEAFFERIRIDLENKTEKALSDVELWNNFCEVSGSSVIFSKKVLNGCVKIMLLCEQINDYITNMELYALRFASFWLLILEHFIKAINEKYSQITMFRQTQGEVLIEYPKLSAAWVVDEDIARLLKSLPSWTAVQNSLFSPSSEQILTPFGTSSSLSGLIESEQEIRERTQRESEILIGNLGTQKQLKQNDLITSLDNIRILACLHETLQWFISRMKEILSGLSPNAKKLTKTLIQINTANGVLLEQMLCDAINDRIETLEKLSDSILLVLHLELRFHCFFHLLPITLNQNISSIYTTQQEEIDREVMEFRRDLTQLHSILQTNLSQWKLKYIQSINKLSEIENKRICRAIFTVQKYLSQLSGRPETEMQRAQMFFEFLRKDLDQLFSSIIERGAVFSFVEYSILLALMIRSHPQLNSQFVPGTFLKKDVNKYFFKFFFLFFCFTGFSSSFKQDLSKHIKSEVQAVVIGGGVVGLSTLYHLAKMGWSNIVLLERKELTSMLLVFFHFLI